MLSGRLSKSGSSIFFISSSNTFFSVPEDIYKNVDFNYIRIEYKKEIMQNDNIKIKCLTDNNYNCLVIFETDNKMNAVVELKLL